MALAIVSRRQIHFEFPFSPHFLESGPSSLEELLELYFKQVASGPAILVDGDRGNKNIWRHALIFYKSNSSEQLKRPVNVCFDASNEVGIDAGGLRQEYFANLLRVMNDEVFEGEEGHRVPQRTWDKSHLLRMAGIMIAHSVLHRGPHFPVLAPLCIPVYTQWKQRVVSWLHNG